MICDVFHVKRAGRWHAWSLSMHPIRSSLCNDGKRQQDWPLRQSVGVMRQTWDALGCQCQALRNRLAFHADLLFVYCLRQRPYGLEGSRLWHVQFAHRLRNAALAEVEVPQGPSQGAIHDLHCQLEEPACHPGRPAKNHRFHWCLRRIIGETQLYQKLIRSFLDGQIDESQLLAIGEYWSSHLRSFV